MNRESIEFHPPIEGDAERKPQTMEDLAQEEAGLIDLIASTEDVVTKENLEKQLEEVKSAKTALEQAERGQVN